MNDNNEPALTNEQQEARLKILRPQLWKKLALGLTIPKSWHKLFDIDAERENLEATRAGMNMTNSPAYDYETAAEWLGIEPDRLRRLVKMREISHVKMARVIRFRLVDLEEYAGDRLRPSRPDHSSEGTP